MRAVRTRQARYRTQERAWFIERLREAKERDGIQSGLCDACGHTHAWPAARWSCSCGKTLCWRQIIRGCGCGGEVEVKE